MRARDSGTNGWVYWFTTDPAATPSAATTNPNYTGTLGTFFIVKSVLTATITTIVSSFPVTYGTPDTVFNIAGMLRNKIIFERFSPAYNAQSDILVFSGTAVQVV